MVTQQNKKNRRCEPKGWPQGWREAICLFFQVGLLINRLLRSFTHSVAKARNDVEKKVCNDVFNLTRLCFIVFFAASVTTQATIITVKEDGTGNYQTIQEAINATIHGDTVLVYPGTYFENVLFNSKKITLASLYLLTQDDAYIHNTIIDGNQNGSCVRIIQGEDETTVLCGFTLQNGSGTWSGINYLLGGGIYIIDADPQVKDCFIKNNTAWGGGGISVWLSNTFLSGCHIIYNYAKGGGGGISIFEDASIEFDSINRNSIYLNHAPGGADIGKAISSPTINIFVDTFTVLCPDFHFAISHDNLGFPVNNFNFDILHAKIDPLDTDLYVSPEGDNSNSGTSAEEPLKTIWYAYKKIYPDSVSPNSIYLLPGTYSSSTNDELLPLSSRSYVSLVGDNANNTIIDAMSNSALLKGNNLTKNYSIKNISFINGFGSLSYITSWGGLNFNENDNLQLENIVVENCVGTTTPGIFISNCNVIINDVKIINNQGGHPIGIGNTSGSIKEFRIANLVVANNTPDNNPEDGDGGGLIIPGSVFTPNSNIGKICNANIFENLRIPDPFFGPGQGVGFLVLNNAKVDASNITVANNILEGEAGAGVKIDEGATVSLYNSIFYGDSLYELTIGSSYGSTYPATANISYSNMEGGEAEIQNWYNQHTINWLDGNLNTNPQWIETGDSAYQLQWNSPCIDAGVPMYEFGMDYPYIKVEDEKIVLYKIDGDTLHIPSTDLAGNPRIVNGRIDMGAYEYQDTGTYIQNSKFQIQNFELSVFPNPFREHAFISFQLTEKAHVKVIIYNMAGRQIKHLMDAKLPTGEYSLTWEGDNVYGHLVNPGTYLVSVYINDQLAASTKVIKEKKHF